MAQIVKPDRSYARRTLWDIGETAPFWGGLHQELLGK